MEDKNSLIYSKKSIFRKIINWFRNIFKKTEKNSIQQEVDVSISYEEDELVSDDIAEVEINESEKEKFFNIYNDVKLKKIDIEDLSTEDLKKFNAMIREEVLLKQKKLDNINQENNRILKEINELNRKSLNNS